MPTINWNIASILNQSNQYNKGAQFQSEILQFNDLHGYLIFYPYGKMNTNTKTNNTIYSHFYLILHAKDNDTRRVDVSFECGSDCSWRTASIKKFKPNENYDIEPALFRMSQVENNPNIKCQITIYNDISVCLHKSMEKLQIESMEEDDNENDKITLIIRNKCINDNNSYDLYAPARKKRKRNKIQNKNELKCNNTFCYSMNINYKLLQSKSNMKLNGNQIEIYANEIKDVEDMIYFMETNILKNNCNVFEMIYLAYKYEIDLLKGECINRLIGNVCIENFYETINVFHQLDIQFGYKRLIEFGKRNVERIKKTKYYDQFSYCLKSELSGRT